MMHDSYKLYAQWGGRGHWDCIHFPFPLILIYTRSICKRNIQVVLVDYGAEFNKRNHFYVFDLPVNFVLLISLYIVRICGINERNIANRAGFW